MYRSISQQWREWIDTNLGRGVDRHTVGAILLDHGFSAGEIDSEIARSLTVLRILCEPEEVAKSNYRQSDQLYIPLAERWPSPDLELYVLKDFLDREECETLVGLIKSDLRPSEITNQNEPDKEFRTSSTCDLGEMGSPLAKEVDRRICRLMGIDPSYAETMQGQFYQVGQQFKLHSDYYKEDDLAEYGGELGQRTYSFLIFLNTPEAGGEIEFPGIKEVFSPSTGTALIWNNLRNDGSPNPLTLHRALPVRSGYKAIVTKWFRARGRSVFFRREKNLELPAYSREGFTKTFIPVPLLHKLVAFYQTNLQRARVERVPGDIIQNRRPRADSSFLVKLPRQLQREIRRTLKPIVESWAGVALRPTYVYGIRQYTAGALVGAHRDRPETHIFGTILNIHQGVEDDWPLVIEDHNCRQRWIILKPGEVLLYEGARLLHCRPMPLKGASFANIFSHFMPKM